MIKSLQKKIENSLPNIMSKNFKMPKTTAIIHSTLLVVLLSNVLIYSYNFMGLQALGTINADGFGLFDFHNFILNNKTFLAIGFVLLFGLNWLVNYLLFRLRKKPIAYSMCFAVLAFQITLISSGISML
jgi:hypothetical protein